MLPFFVPTLNHVGQISHTRLRCCYDHCQYIRMGAYYYPLGAAWLNCCAPVTWSDGGRVAADRGRGTLSQHLKPFEGFRIRYCSESSTQA